MFFNTIAIQPDQVLSNIQVGRQHQPTLGLQHHPTVGGVTLSPHPVEDSLTPPCGGLSNPTLHFQLQVSRWLQASSEGDEPQRGITSDLQPDLNTADRYPTGLTH